MEKQAWDNCSAELPGLTERLFLQTNQQIWNSECCYLNVRWKSEDEGVSKVQRTWLTIDGSLLQWKDVYIVICEIINKWPNENENEHTILVYVLRSFSPYNVFQRNLKKKNI